MSKFTFAALVTAILITTSANAGYQDFVLVNATPSQILSVYVSPSGSDDWEEDILGDNVLDAGETLSITFNGRTERFWDVKIVYTGYKPDAVFGRIDLGTVSELILTDDFGGGTTMTPVTANAPSVNRPAPAPNPMPFFFPSSLQTPGPSPVIDQTGTRICPGCHGTGSCSICHGTGTYSCYGVSTSCDTRCSSCGGTGRY